MRRILLIATGGTIASRYTETGLLPQISGEELLSFVPEAREFFGCERMEEIVKLINQKEEGGSGRAEEFIKKFTELEVQHA